MSKRQMPALGTLRERVELFTNNQTIGGAGGLSDNFVSLGTVWARVRFTAGSLSTFLDARNSKTTCSIVIRYRSDLKPGDRIIYREQMLEIISADDLNGRRAYLNCVCSELEVTG